MEKHKQLAGRIENVEPALQAVSGQQFYNTSPLTFTKLLDDPDAIADSLKLYIGCFSEAAKDVIDKFDFGVQIDRLRRANVLYQVIGKFAEIDLHPDAVSNIEMGYLYHQWDAVLRIQADATANGAGRSYLIQHSAGSGKSNTIAWTAHRLSTLHTAEDQKIFDKVVVITDRVILDRQLQDTIYQFEHARGVVVKIDEDSTQLAQALAGEQARIIITTLQKFPFVIGKIGEVPARNYAVVIDEAHSSQTGEAAKDLRLALGAAEEQELTAAEAEDTGLLSNAIDPVEEALARSVGARRGRQSNLSYFAFTATPKGRTLEMFGRLDPATQKHRPFHLYSMRQAIEEGFIMDVLANYTTYQTFWKIEKATEHDPEYDAKKARRAIARFVSLHPHHLAQKAEIIVEHFRQHTA